MRYLTVRALSEGLYLMDLEKEQWGRRPLAKLTHDIDLQITEEQGKAED